MVVNSLFKDIGIVDSNLHLSHKWSTATGPLSLLVFLFLLHSQVTSVTVQ